MPCPDLLSRLLHTLPENLADQSVEAALSGGLDSVVLLHLLAQLRKHLSFSLSAVHVHHGLQSAADDWQQFCAQYCQSLAIPLRIEKVSVDCTQGLGVEAAARQARYAVFEKSTARFLALAHHADDQIETFFLSALRGGGIRALSAMPTIRPLNDNTLIWRPILPFTRTELSTYAEANGLTFVSDPSNQNNSYLRNWLRNRGLPEWRARVPHFDNHISASVARLQDELALLEELLAEDEHAVYHNGWFHIENWRQLSPARQRQQLLRFAQRHHLGTPTQASIHNFAQVLNQADRAQWQLPNGEAYAYRKRLFPLEQGWQNRFRQPEQHNTLSALCTEYFHYPPETFLPEKQLSHIVLRTTRPNDRIAIKHGHKTVQKLLQERYVAPFMRPLWPVIVDEHDECIAVLNLWTHEQWKPKHATPVARAELLPYIVF